VFDTSQLNILSGVNALAGGIKYTMESIGLDDGLARYEAPYFIIVR
jgi:hypothetical protein